MEEFPGYYQTGDAGYLDEDGYIFVMTRTDDIINVAGHRLSTGAMEEVLADNPDVAECAVIDVADQLKGQVPLGFLVLSAGVNRLHDVIIGEVVKLVRERIGPVAAFKTATVIDCRKPAPEKFYVAQCRRLPTVRIIRCPRRSTILRSSMRSSPHSKTSATPVGRCCDVALLV